MKKRNYPEILSKETDPQEIENLLKGYDMKAFQPSQFVGIDPIDASTVLSKVVYPAYALNPRVKTEIEQVLYKMLSGTDYDVLIVVLYVMSELFKESKGIAPFKMDFSKILARLKTELNQREFRIRGGLRYPNGYTRTSAWDELIRFRDVCKREYRVELF